MKVTLSGAEVKLDEDELDAYRTIFSGLRWSIEPPGVLRESIEVPRWRESYEGRETSDSEWDRRLLGLFEPKGKQSGGGGGGGGGDMVVTS